MFSATFPESKDKDSFLYPYTLMSSKLYRGPGTYGGSDFSLDVSSSHIGPDAAGAAPKPDIIHIPADLAGRATVNAGGLTGTLTQTVFVAGSSDRVHMSLSWECLRFGF